MRKKRIAWFLLAALLAAMASPSALAAVLRASTSPNSLTGDGFVTLALELRNDGQEAMSGITITGPGVSYVAEGQTIAPAGTLTLTIPDVFIAADQIGTPLSYTVSWKQGSASQSKKVSVTVYGVSEMGLVASRSASKTSAQPGEVIYLTYSIHNTGTTSLQKVSITDKNIAGSAPIASNVTIAPGETYQKVYQYTMGAATVISKPVVTYTTQPDPRTPRTYNIDNLSLGVINANVEVEVVQGETTAAGTDFSVRLANNGNQTIRNISVTAENGDKLHEGTFSLSLGEERLLTYHVDPEAARTVRFTVAGTGGTGVAYSQVTDRCIVRTYIDPSLLGLSLSARMLAPPDASGTARLEFVISNTGSLEMQDVQLTETELGLLQEVGVVAPGETRLEIPLPLTQNRRLELVLTAADPAGNPHEYRVFLYAGEPAAPVGVTPGADPGRGSGVLITQVIQVCAILLGILTIAGGVLLLAAKRYDKQRRAALRHKKRA